MLNAYPKVLHVGSLGTDRLLDGEVSVQVKYDGSQFSAQVDENNNFIYRSSGQIINPNCCDKIFQPTVAHFESLKSVIDFSSMAGLIFRGEAFCKPRQNTLTYARVPKGHFILFDVEKRDGSYVTKHPDIQCFANRLQVDCVEELYYGRLTLEQLQDMQKKYFEQECMLGGCKMEGIVIKNYNQLIEVGGKIRPVFCKLVRPEFKEMNHGNPDWQPSKGKFEEFAEGFKTEARWRKAIEHLRDRGKLSGELKDIPVIIKEVHDDILAEQEAFIKERLFQLFWKDIKKAAVKSLPEWYKSVLTETIKL